MTVGELKKELSNYDDNLEIMLINNVTHCGHYLKFIEQKTVYVLQEDKSFKEEQRLNFVDNIEKSFVPNNNYDDYMVELMSRHSPELMKELAGIIENKKLDMNCMERIQKERQQYIEDIKSGKKSI